MAAVLKHWREAATLIVIAKSRKLVPNLTSALNRHGKSSELSLYDYDILMLKRSTKSKFMPNLYVFPGGTAEDADFSSEWLDLFKMTGDQNLNNLLSFVKSGGIGPPMFNRKRNSKFEHIPSELAFRICAIRETFEESGVLLVRSLNNLDLGSNFPHSNPYLGKVSSLESEVTDPWRSRVDKDPAEFINMCKELNVIPDVWSLSEWSNWLTPTISDNISKSRRRYDTAFYICVLDHIPSAVHDNNETTHAQWTAPDILIKTFLSVNGGLAPPQVYELGRMLNFQHVKDIHKFAWDRSLKHRVSRYFPVPIICEDGIGVVYPGDELYPENPDVEAANPPLTVKCKVAELSVNYPKMNRWHGTHTNPNRRVNCVNVTANDGHVMPKVDLDFLGLPEAKL